MVYRVAVIGCGKIGSEYADDPKVKDIYTHIEAYRTCPDTELVAICDIDEKKVDTCGDRWNIPHRFTDYREMIDKMRPDIVSVCTPDSTHFPIIQTILKHHTVKAVFSEKPLAGSVSEAEELVSLAEKKNILLAVNYSRRYSRCLFGIKKAINAGKIGKIRAVNGYYTKGTLHNGTHWIDLARFLVGEIEKVQGFDILMEGGMDPSIDILIKFAPKITGILQACDATQFSIFEMDIIGTSGRVCITDSGHTVMIYVVAESPHYSGYKSLVKDGTYTDCLKNMMLHAVEDIIECLSAGKTPLCSGHDGVEALAIAWEARKTAELPYGKTETQCL